MPIDDFIITVFCWVEGHLSKVTGGVKLRTRGFPPQLSDSEVITMEIIGEFCGYDGDEAIWEYFKQHGGAWFPRLGDRTTSLHDRRPIGGVSSSVCTNSR